MQQSLGSTTLEAKYEISLVYQFPVTFRNSSCEFLMEPRRQEICVNWP